MVDQLSETLSWDKEETDISDGNWLIIKQLDRLLDELPKSNDNFWAWLYEQNLLGTSIDYSAFYNVFSAQAIYDAPCQPGSGGTLLFGLKVIKGNPDLKYTLNCSYGKLEQQGDSSRATEAIIRKEVNLEDTIIINDYYIEDFLKVTRTSNRVGNLSVSKYPGKWEGYVFNEEGRNLSGSRFSAPYGGREDDDTNQIIYLYPEGVKEEDRELYYGTYRIHATERYDYWIIQIKPRTSVVDVYDINEIYASTVRAFYDKKATVHTMNIPEEAKECVSYFEYVDENGVIQIGINPGNNWDSETNTWNSTNEDPLGECVCWECGGSGQLPDCVEGPTVDCTCPTCGGSGDICGENESEADEGGNTTTGGANEGTGDCYRLKIRLQKCTNEPASEPYYVRVPCPEAPKVGE